MKLYWRIKRNGKWTWRPVPKEVAELAVSLIPLLSGPQQEEEE